MSRSVAMTAVDVTEAKPKSETQTRVVKAKNKRDGLYVHPKGDQQKQIKVSCASCISGHRSGECNHFDRILLQIRAAGRPSNTCHHSLSCGGSCLKQKAFVIPGEDPKWCRNHRSCIENWEYSEYCPPYPGSGKRKGRPSSPTRSSTSSSTPSVAQKISDDRPAQAQRAVSSSCCSSKSSSRIDPQIPGLGTPAGRPIMATASAQTATTPWNPKVSDQTSFPSAFDPCLGFTAEPEIFGASNGQTPLPQTPHFPYFDPYELALPPLGDHHHSLTTYTTSNLQPLSATAPPAPPPASVPLHPLVHHRQQSDREEPQKCPGNGFQCPCDEDCICADCYTHQRGFWTLPVTLDNPSIPGTLQDYHQHHAPPPPAPLHRTTSSTRSRKRSSAHLQSISRVDEDNADGENTDGGENASVLGDDFVDPQNLFGLDPAFQRYY